MTRVASNPLLEGAQHHQAGRLTEAERLYRDVLARDSNNVDALYLLGTIYYQRGSLSSAHLFLRRAVAAQPNHPEAYNNLGLVLASLGKGEEARSAFRKAVELSASYADAHYNLANLLREQNQWADAETSYRQALKLRPGWAEALDNLGLTLRLAGRLDEAEQVCQEARQRRPGLLGPLLNLGAMAKARGDLKAARAYFEQGVEAAPNSASAHTNLGIVAAHEQDWECADRHTRWALEIDSASSIAWNNRGLVLFLLGQNADAAHAFRESVQRDPSFADAWNNLGSALYRLQSVTEAAAAYERSVQLKPTPTSLKNWGSILEHTCQWEKSVESFQQASCLKGNDRLLELRSHLVCPTVFDSTAQIDEYRERLTCRLHEAIDHRIHQPMEAWLDADFRPSFAWQFHGRCDRTIRSLLARVVEDSVPSYEPVQLTSGLPTVGFLVAPGHEYAFARSIGGMFPHFHSKEWRACILGAAGSRDKLRPLVSEEEDFVPIPGDLNGIVRTMRQEKIDLLYHWEIGTGAMNYLLPFCRPTPIQMTSWGIQITSGIPAVDYYVSSRWVEPENGQQSYTEKLVLLDTLLSYQPRLVMPERPLGRDALTLPTAGTIYLCAQQLGKFHPDFDVILAGILSEDPTGYLVMTESSFPHENDRLRARWTKTLGPLLPRVLFTPKKTGGAYASLLHAADVVLDPTQFGGVNTTYDALSAGRLTVTWPGPLHRSRYTYGCFRRIDMTETVVHSADEYIACACRLGRDAELRRSLEERIIERRDVLFECKESAWELQRWMLDTIEAHRSGRAKA